MTEEPLGLGFALNLVLGGLFGLVVRALYKRYATTAPGSDGLANVFPLFILATITMIAVVQLSLALSLGLIAALTVTRFRAPIKSPQELVYLLFCVSIGLALGAGEPMLAIVAVSTVSLFVLLGGVTNRGERPRSLVVSVGGDPQYFFPRDASSGLERLRRIRPFTLLRLDQDGQDVEARGIVTVAGDEAPGDVLSEIRKELSDLRVSSVDVNDVHPAVNQERRDSIHGRGAPPPRRAPRRLRARGRVEDSQSDAVGRVSGNAFEILDASPATRAVDFVRREVKFALTDADSAKVRSILKVNCRRVVHGDGPVSRVQTIYFDDARLSNYYENLDGVPRRAKLRLRWYDDGDEEGRLFFEIKRRVDSLVYKERFAIRSRVPLAGMTYGEILTELRSILPAPARETLLAHSDAVVMSEYRREYFCTPGSPARITLDEGIVSYSQMGSTRPSKRFGVRDDQLVILEAKFPPRHDGELRELLHPLEPHLTKSSKYVRACQRSGLLHRIGGSGQVVSHGSRGAVRK
ncbi:MAG: VTC domain-containing protein [Vicinamibacteria bacterium]